MHIDVAVVVAGALPVRFRMPDGRSRNEFQMWVATANELGAPLLVAIDH